MTPRSNNAVLGDEPGNSNQSLRSKSTAKTRRIGVYLARLPGHNDSIDVDDVSVTAIPESSSLQKCVRIAMFAMGAID